MAKKVDFGALLGMDRAQLGEMLLMVLEKVTTETKTRHGLFCHEVDPATGECHSTLVFAFASETAALEALKDHMKVGELPGNVFWDIEEVPYEEASDHVGANTPEEIEDIKAQSGWGIKENEAYWDKRRETYERAVIALGRPMNEQENADWNELYPAPGAK